MQQTCCSLLCTVCLNACRGDVRAQGLAKSIAWDGEGATCLMEVRVSGAPSDEAARTISKSVVASSLVKAAVYGHDPNWGRIACAAGCVFRVEMTLIFCDMHLALRRTCRVT